MDRLEYGLINLNEKRPVEQRDREYLIFALDGGYEEQEPIAAMMHLFDPFEITLRERNSIILESAYKNDEKLVAALVLFGG